MFIFNKENLEKAKRILTKYPDDRKSSAVLPLLDLAQRQNNGWLSTEVIQYVADYISESYMRVYEVASFYSMFYLNPIGKYNVKICTTIPCLLKGAVEILKKCEKITATKCGDTSIDGLFTVSEVECLGACINAPLAQINDDYYENLTPNKIKILLTNIKNKLSF